MHNRSLSREIDLLKSAFENLIDSLVLEIENLESDKDTMQNEIDGLNNKVEELQKEINDFNQ